MAAGTLMPAKVDTQEIDIFVAGRSLVRSSLHGNHNCRKILVSKARREPLLTTPVDREQSPKVD